MLFMFKDPKKSSSTTTPSTTTKGPELPLIEPVPLIRMVGAEPASPSVA